MNPIIASFLYIFFTILILPLVISLVYYFEEERFLSRDRRRSFFQIFKVCFKSSMGFKVVSVFIATIIFYLISLF